MLVGVREGGLVGGFAGLAHDVGGGVDGFDVDVETVVALAGPLDGNGLGALLALSLRGLRHVGGGCGGLYWLEKVEEFRK